MGFWIFLYKKPHENPKGNAAELAYIHKDDHEHQTEQSSVTKQPKTTIAECLKYKQTWAFVFGKFMTDGVWWFFLFWMPAYLSAVYDIKSSDTEGQLAIFVLYAITMLSIYGGWLPTYFVEKKGMNAYEGRMKAMLLFAFVPLVVLFAQPLGHISYWIPVILIGFAGAAPQLVFMGFKGEEAGYFIIFSFCSIAYLIAWIVMKTLVPKLILIRN